MNDVIQIFKWLDRWCNYDNFKDVGSLGHSLTIFSIVMVKTAIVFH
jgi:hypothetical protein